MEKEHSTDHRSYLYCRSRAKGDRLYGGLNLYLSLNGTAVLRESHNSPAEDIASGV